MSNEWITDRKPEHGDGWDGYVWRFEFNKLRRIVRTQDVKDGEPWMPITPPEPYVKQRRYVVYYCGESRCWWLLCEGTRYVRPLWELTDQNEKHREAAERIAAIYEEVMP